MPGSLLQRLMVVITILVALAAADTASAEITFIAPRDGSSVSMRDVSLIGRDGATANGEMTVILNGSTSETVPVQAGVFSLRLKLREGRNSIVLQSGNKEKEFMLEYRPQSSGGQYVFHGGTDEGTCRECHTPGARWEKPGHQKELCYSCHDQLSDVRYMHGPVGAGQCTFCHDPHGSEKPFFLADIGKGLCLRCHTQSASGTHLQDPEKVDCLNCHDPHGASQRYFLSQRR